MEYEMKVAQEGLKLEQDKEYRMRENLSKFLGSYKKRGYGFGIEETEVKVLSWAEIFFELGKMKGDFDQMNEVFAIRNEHKRMFKDIQDLQEEVFKNKEKDILPVQIKR